MSSGMFVPTLFGISGFLIVGMGAAYQCSFNWVGNGSLICGGVFIVACPIGYLAGVFVFWLGRALIRVLAGRSANT